MRLNIEGIIVEILKTIESKNNFLITTHKKLDGDGLGCELVLRDFLIRKNKKVEIINFSPVPSIYKFLDDVQYVKVSQHLDDFFEIAIILDCSEIKRTGIDNLLENTEKIINIDHHPGNNFFGDINYVDPQVSSTAELVYNLLTFSSLPLTYNQALAIYVGILTDTNRFQAPNTTPSSHRIVAQLLEYGFSPDKINQEIYQTQTPARLKLLGLCLSTLDLIYENKVAYMIASPQMYEISGAEESDTEDFINFICEIKDVEIAIFFREIKENLIKVSLRSRGKIDVNKIANNFGGGGHRNAAGFTYHDNIETTKKVIFDMLRNVL